MCARQDLAAWLLLLEDALSGASCDCTQLFSAIFSGCFATELAAEVAEFKLFADRLVARELQRELSGWLNAHLPRLGGPWPRAAHRLQQHNWLGSWLCSWLCSCTTPRACGEFGEKKRLVLLF
jgi:hypothetical protein